MERFSAVFFQCWRRGHFLGSGKCARGQRIANRIGPPPPSPADAGTFSAIPGRPTNRLGPPPRAPGNVGNAGDAGTFRGAKKVPTSKKAEKGAEGAHGSTPRPHVGTFCDNVGTAGTFEKVRERRKKVPSP